jgi:hypothetical protein
MAETFLHGRHPNVASTMAANPAPPCSPSQLQPVSQAQESSHLNLQPCAYLRLAFALYQSKSQRLHGSNLASQGAESFKAFSGSLSFYLSSSWLLKVRFPLHFSAGQAAEKVGTGGKFHGYFPLALETSMDL